MTRPVLFVAAVLAALLASGAVAGAASDEARIVGGSDATRPWPAQGALEIGAGTFICGGTLVSGRWFLTAAHCVTDPADGSVRPASTFSVRLGSSNRNLGTAFGVSSSDGVIRHELYSPITQTNDVALLKLTPAPQPSQSFCRSGLSARTRARSGCRERSRRSSAGGRRATSNARRRRSCKRRACRSSATPPVRRRTAPRSRPRR
ncbi:MAG: hypothetical protein QOK16_1388 [Solirubrobacteraceae bacterium]|nr:hypothetical protein [Solirubrobacteraceae bacterium]